MPDVNQDVVSARFIRRAMRSVSEKLPGPDVGCRRHLRATFPRDRPSVSQRGRGRDDNERVQREAREKLIRTSGVRTQPCRLHVSELTC